MSFVVYLANCIIRLYRFGRRRILLKYRYSVLAKIPTNILLVFLLLKLFALILLLLVYLFQLRNKFMTELKFKIGWWKTAVLAVSILDTVENVNFPEQIFSRVKNDSESRRNFEDETMIQSYINSNNYWKENGSVLWKVDGFTQYTSQLDGLEEESKLGYSNFSSFKELASNLKETGYWIFSFGPNNNEVQDSKRSFVTSSITAFRITEDLAKLNGIPLENLEVAIAIKAFVAGEAAIVIRYEDNSSAKFHLDEIKSHEFSEKGFCNKILNVPFDKRINMIYIRPTSTNLRRHGLVIIDQVIVIVSTRNVTESLMHTLVPINWC